MLYVHTEKSVVVWYYFYTHSISSNICILILVLPNAKMVLLSALELILFKKVAKIKSNVK